MILNWIKYLESVGNVPISNMHSYIEGMVLSYADKLFFLDKIDTDIIVDFGCADGAILEKISRINPKIKLVGYDLDDKMLSIAKSKLGKKAVLTSDWKKVENIISKYEKPTLVLSSVIHEVYSYSHSFVIKRFWESQVFGDKFKWICIRDMIPMAEMHKHEKTKFMGDVMRVRNRSDKEILLSFENHWGKISNNYRTFIHYLLKYKYVDNWDREVKENYVPITLETLYKKIPSNYKIVYQDNFILPILQQQVKKDFNVDIKHTTHTKLIIENKNLKNKLLRESSENKLLKQLNYDEFRNWKLNRKEEILSVKEYEKIVQILKDKTSNPFFPYNRVSYIEIICGYDDENQIIIRKYDDEWYSIVWQKNSDTTFYISDTIDGLNEFRLK